MADLAALKKEVQLHSDKEKGLFLQRFLKTGKGQYAEGDIFLGLIVPVSRRIAQKFKELPLAHITQLLSSKFHEERLIALLILVYQFERGDEEKKAKIYALYLKNTRFINNWDLVDTSAEKIGSGASRSSQRCRRLDAARDWQVHITRRRKKVSRPILTNYAPHCTPLRARALSGE